MKTNYTGSLVTSFILAIIFLLLCASSNAQICSVNAGLDKTICVTQQPLTLSGTSGSSQSLSVYLWTKLAGPPATINSPTSISTTVTGLTPGNYVFQVTSKCTDGLFAKDIVAVTILPEPPTSLAGPDLNFCFNGPIQLAANAVTAPNTGTWTVSPSGGTFAPNANAPDAVFTGLPRAGIRRFTWTISNGACSKSDVMAATFSQPVIPVSAGPDDSLACKGSCKVMKASYPGFAPQNGLWTKVSGPNTPVFSNATSPTSKVCGLIPGHYVFRWTVTGTCAQGSDDMILEVINIKEPPATLGDQVYAQFCEDPAVTSEVLIGAPLLVGDTATWTQTGGGSIATFSPDNHQASVSVGNLTGTFPYKFTYSHTNASGCTMVNLYTVYRSQFITGLTDPVDQVLPCDVTGTTFNISYNKLSTISNSVVRDATLVSGPSDSGIIAYASSVFVGSIRTETWEVSRLTAPGTYIYRISYSNACGMVFQDISITVSRTPGSVNAGSDIILPCRELNVSPTGSANSPGTYTWSQVSGPNNGVITGQNTLSPELSGLVQGVYTIRITNWGGNACPFKTDDMNITVTQLPPLVATTGADTAICAGNYRLYGNTPLPTETGVWTVSPSPGVVFSPGANAPSPFVSGLAPNSVYSFTWTVSNACGSVADTQFLTTGFFYSAPVPDAGQDLCQPPGTTLSLLQGNDPMGAVVTWTALTTGSDISPADQQQGTATFSDGNGTYLFEYALGSPGCATLRDTVRVTVLTNISIDAGADVDICTPTLPCTADLNATLVAYSRIFEATWFQVSGPSVATIASPNDPLSSIGNLVPGTYQFEYRMMPGNDCQQVSDTVIVSVAQSPSVAYAGPDQSICNVNPRTFVTLAAHIPTVGTGYWQIISAPQGSTTPVLSDPNSPTSTISNLTQGEYRLRWTVINGTGCPGSTDDLIINVSANANAGPNVAACSSAFIQLTGSPNTVGTWSFVSGPAGSEINPNSGNTAIVSGLVTGSSPSVYTFMYSLPAIGTCPASTNTMVFTNYQQPSLANAGGNKYLCAGETSLTLSGNIPLAGTATWSWQSGPNTPAAGIPNVTSHDTTLNGLIPGIYFYQYRINTNSVCIASTENIQIIKQAKANANADLRLCNVPAANLAASVPLFGEGTWSLISGPQPGNVAFSNVNNPSVTATGLVPGVYIFRWTLAAVGTCAADHDDVQVTIDAPLSEIYAGPDQAFCEGTATPFSIGPVATAGIAYNWTPAALLSSAFVAQPTFQGINNAGDYVYTVRASRGSCESYATININVKPKPFTNIEVMEGGCAATFTASDPGAGVVSPVYSWNFGDSDPAIGSGAGPHSVTFHNSGPRNIMLDINSADGCSNTSSISYYPFCVLPVKLVAFDAVWQKDYAALSWEVAGAINLNHFEIERSFDGISFNRIGNAAYTNNVNKYTFPDRTVNPFFNTTVYYRLRMVDADNSFSYSAIKIIKLAMAEGITVWPNPFLDKIKITLKSQTVTENISIKMFNAAGALVAQKQINFSQANATHELNNLGMLPAGLYTLQIINAGKITGNYKLIKYAL